MNEEEKIERLNGYKEDMDDDYRSWQQAEQEVKDAIAWRDKLALNYANSTVKYFNYKKEIEE